MESNDAFFGWSSIVCFYVSYSLFSNNQWTLFFWWYMGPTLHACLHHHTFVVSGLIPRRFPFFIPTLPRLWMKLAVKKWQILFISGKWAYKLWFNTSVWPEPSPVLRSRGVFFTGFQQPVNRRLELDFLLLGRSCRIAVYAVLDSRNKRTS